MYGWDGFVYHESLVLEAGVGPINQAHREEYAYAASFPIHPKRVSPGI